MPSGAGEAFRHIRDLVDVAEETLRFMGFSNHKVTRSHPPSTCFMQSFLESRRAPWLYSFLIAQGERESAVVLERRRGPEPGCWFRLFV